MALTNPWIGPMIRSYDEIKQTILSTYAQQEEAITRVSFDRTEGNILTQIISFLSAIAEGLHYYIDSMYREAFFTTARRLSSLMAHARLVDYHFKAAYPSTCMVELDTIGEDSSSSIKAIPAASFTGNDGRTWTMTHGYLYPAGVSKGDKITVILGLSQREDMSADKAIGTTPLTGTIQFSLNVTQNKYYVEGSMTLKIGGESWELVETFAYSQSNSKHFMVWFNDAMKPVIIFGDGEYGMRPAGGLLVTGRWSETDGEVANGVKDNFNTVPQNIASLWPNTPPTVKQTEASVGGTNYETFDTLKTRVPLSIKHLGVAVTKKDYEDLVMSSGLIAKANVNYLCGKYVRLFILPFPDKNGDVSSNPNLVAAIRAIINKSKLITTSIVIFPIVRIRAYIDLTVIKNFNVTEAETTTQIKTALINGYNINSTNIGETIYLSDLYALIDNLTAVNHCLINSIVLVSEPLFAKYEQDKESDFYSTIALEFNTFDSIVQNSNLIPDGVTTDYLVLKIIISSDQNSFIIQPKESTKYLVSTSGGSTLNFDTNYSANVTTASGDPILMFNLNLKKKNYRSNDVYTIYICGGINNVKSYEFGIPMITSDSIKIAYKDE
jgi:hypothetical protein